MLLWDWRRAKTGEKTFELSEHFVPASKLALVFWVDLLFEFLRQWDVWPAWRMLGNAMLVPLLVSSEVMTLSPELRLAKPWVSWVTMVQLSPKKLMLGEVGLREDDTNFQQGLVLVGNQARDFFWMKYFWDTPMLDLDETSTGTSSVGVGFRYVPPQIKSL